MPGIPIRLRIPVLKIDAELESIGRTKRGAMDVPKDLAHGGWFNLGPRPGEVGSAVVDGHSGWQADKQAVFDKLHKLRIGDRVDVVDENNATTTFVVRELRTYAHNQNASNVFESSDGMAHLNLITCQGVWNEEKHSYPDRLVVFADKVVESR
jgi:LPXTG-site transpeptidase (sortase) family protein